MSQAATQLYHSLLRNVKLRADVELWVGFAALMFRSEKPDDARKLYEQSLLSLDQKSRKFFPRPGAASAKGRGRRYGVDWGAHATPTFVRGRF